MCEENKQHKFRVRNDEKRRSDFLTNSMEIAHRKIKVERIFEKRDFQSIIKNTETIYSKPYEEVKRIEMKKKKKEKE